MNSDRKVAASQSCTRDGLTPNSLVLISLLSRKCPFGAELAIRIDGGQPGDGSIVVCYILQDGEPEGHSSS